MERQISQKAARRALLAHQGLWPPRAMRGWKDVSAHFARVGSMQFDPVDVAGISPEISLCARVRDFRREMLADWLYGQRVLADVWDKNACIAPAGDVPDLLPNRLDADMGWHFHAKVDDLEKATEEVLARLRADGPLSTAAFHGNDAQRVALERLRMCGAVVIHHREGRRRFFDVAERFGGAPVPSPLQGEELLDWLVLRRIGAVGLLWNKRSDAFLGIAGMDTAKRNAAFERLERDGRIAQVQVEDLKSPLFYRVGDEAMFDAKDRPAKATLLGPLDNFLWDRALIRTLFGFHYMWEVYTPAEKRVYGSYTVPVLYGDRLIGRVQMACAEGALRVAQWWPEEKLSVTGAMRHEVEIALAAHARMLGLRCEAEGVL